jgi:hypothetical protein
MYLIGQKRGAKMATPISGPLIPEANVPTPVPAPVPKAASAPQFTTIALNPVEDTVQISSPAPASAAHTQPVTQSVQIPTTAQIVLMERLGQSVQQIATHFGMSVEQVLSYLQTPSQPAPPAT